jgi:hypothetical protein
MAFNPVPVGAKELSSVPSVFRRAILLIIVPLKDGKSPPPQLFYRHLEWLWC